MDKNQLNKFKKILSEVREKREKQIKYFVPLAKEIIEYVMHSEFTTTTDLKRMFNICNAVGDYNTIEKEIKSFTHLPGNNSEWDKLLNHWLELFKLMKKNGVKGFVPNNRISVKGVDDKNLRLIKKTFKEIISIEESYENLTYFSEEVKKLVGVPKIKHSFTQCLNYLKPTIFPITNNRVKKMFFELFGYEIHFKDYSQLVLKVEEISKELGEKDFGIIDSVGWKWGKQNNYLNNIQSDKSFSQGHKSKNTILYGPPGTGKTYKTKRLAVEVIEK